MSEYQQILDFWFPSHDTIPSFWFNKNKETDEYIITHFSELLIKAENHNLNHWKTDINGHLALIILLDQFSRHIYRNNPDKLFLYDIIAYHHAKEFFLEKRDIELNNLYKIMALMSFRHQENIEDYNFVIDYMNKETDPIWNGFKKHTMIKYQYLLEHNTLPNRDIVKFDYSKFNDILEFPWEPSMQNSNIESDLTTTLINFVDSNKDIINKNLLIVSLSGGVDSMLILAVLANIKSKYDNLLIVAIHLDYHNRPETGLEAEFLFRWCSFMNIPLYYRYIHEGVRERNSKHREEYEELTKEIRFNIYKSVENIYKDFKSMGVILGHHKGDLQENIFLNVVKGRTLTDLSVIKEQSDILGVKILRPLISHPKKDIFSLAYKINVPYFKNTTPLWSNRGQFREIIQPAIIKTFGEGVLTNLSKIGKESDELQLLIKTNIIDPYMKTIEVIENVHIFYITPNQSFTYWKYIFHEWCHINKLPLISHKVLKQIYEKLYLKSSEKVNITCNTNIKLIINNNYINIKINFF